MVCGSVLLFSDSQHNPGTANRSRSFHSDYGSSLRCALVAGAGEYWQARILGESRVGFTQLTEPEHGPFAGLDHLRVPAGGAQTHSVGLFTRPFHASSDRSNESAVGIHETVRHTRSVEREGWRAGAA